MSPHIERKGWDHMCKYSYLSGACANRHVESLQCLGEDECEFSDMNILGPLVSRDGSREGGANRWLTLYCETHGKYLCGRGDDCRAPSARPPKPPVYMQRRLDDRSGGW